MTAPELVTSDLRATCLEARDKLIELDAANMILRSDLDEARSKRLLLELCLSCILPIAEEHAEQTKNDIYTRTCAFIRSSLGKPPRKGKPVLAVVKNGEA